MGKRGEYWETSGGNLVDPPEVTEASKSREFQQPSPKDVGLGVSDSASPAKDGDALDGSDDKSSQAFVEPKANDPGDGSPLPSTKEDSMDGAEAALRPSDRESGDTTERPSPSEISHV